MRNRWVSLLGVLIIGIPLVLAGCAKEAPEAQAPAGGELPELHWYFGEFYSPRDSAAFHDAEAMLNACTERTDGRWTFTLYGSELTGWEEGFEMVQRGDVDGVLSGISPSFDTRWNIVYAPFIATDYESAFKLFGPGGCMNKVCEEIAADSNLIHLGSWHEAFTGVDLVDKTPITPEEAQGIKIRSPGLASIACGAEQLGYTVSVIPMGEVPTAVATGVVEGECGGGYYQSWLLVRDLCNVHIHTYQFLDVLGFMYNLDSWNSLPSEYQSIMREEVDRASVERQGDVPGDDAYYKNLLIDRYGWTIIDMLDYPEQHARNVKLARECWTEVLDPECGTTLMNKVRKCAGVPAV